MILLVQLHWLKFRCWPNLQCIFKDVSWLSLRQRVIPSCIVKINSRALRATWQNALDRCDAHGYSFAGVLHDVARSGTHPWNNDSSTEMVASFGICEIILSWQSISSQVQLALCIRIGTLVSCLKDHSEDICYMFPKHALAWGAVVESWIRPVMVWRACLFAKLMLRNSKRVHNKRIPVHLIVHPSRCLPACPSICPSFLLAARSCLKYSSPG